MVYALGRKAATAPLVGRAQHVQNPSAQRRVEMVYVMHLSTVNALLAGKVRIVQRQSVQTQHPVARMESVCARARVCATAAMQALHAARYIVSLDAVSMDNAEALTTVHATLDGLAPRAFSHLV